MENQVQTITEMCKIFGIPEQEWQRYRQNPDYVTLLARRICRLQRNTPEEMRENFDAALAILVQELSRSGVITIFLAEMKRVLQKPDLLDRWEDDAAPFLLLAVEDPTCYDILPYFAEKLQEALLRAGRRTVLMRIPAKGAFALPIYQGEEYRAVIGFQTGVMEMAEVRKLPCPKFQFWFDHPVFYAEEFRKMDPDCTYFFQDGDYAEFARTRLGLQKSFHFPPGGDASIAGDSVADGEGNDSRDWDLIFIGTWFPLENYPKEYPSDEDEKTLFRTMMEHPDFSYEKACLQHCSEEELLPYMKRHLGLLQYVRCYVRGQVINVLIQNGVSIHVFGDSWKNYRGPGAENLIIHPSVAPADSIACYRRAKLSLNVMSCHKSGMTERIIHGMLAGAVCVTDETTYLKQYADQGAMLTYRLDELETLPGRIRELLQREDFRKVMAERAKTLALERETWDQRVVDLLQKFL